MTKRNILIVTLPPFEGGVPAKTRILCHHLQSLGHHVTVAWYATFRHHPELNVPSWKLAPGRHPMVQAEPAFKQFPGWAVGCWFPELEAPYYCLSSRWRTLIDAHDRHIAVGGPPMVGNILARAQVPFWLWCASDVMADRQDRQRHMSVPRSLVDAIITRPWLRHQQRHLLERCPLSLGVSTYTVERLKLHGANPQCCARLPIPICTESLSPQQAPTADIIGFAARFEDPRKNLDLLLRSTLRLRRHRPGVKLRLAGAVPSAKTIERITQLGLNNSIEFVGELPPEEMVTFFQSLDVFALPSWQEGLCIAGLEAMACGVPVVSTRCGGPQDYVRDGISGYSCGWSDESMAGALDAALTQRNALSNGARRMVTKEFSISAFAEGVASAWQQVWGETP